MATNYTQQDFTCLQYQIVSHAKVPSPCTLLWLRTILLKSKNTEIKRVKNSYFFLPKGVQKGSHWRVQRARQQLWLTSKFQFCLYASLPTRFKPTMVTKQRLNIERMGNLRGKPSWLYIYIYSFHVRHPFRIN
jgi:hypothetical protein